MTAPTWDLEAMLPGGLSGQAYRTAYDALSEELDALVEQADAVAPLPEGAGALVRTFEQLYGLVDRISLVALFAHCHTCADTSDRLASSESGRVQTLWDRYLRAMVPLSDRVASCDDAAFAALLAQPGTEPMQSALKNIRARAPLMLPRGEQALLRELQQDGLGGWSRHYDRVSGRLEVVLGDGQVVSVGRAKNLLSTPDGAQREMALGALDRAWGTAADDCAAILTHIVGTRRTLNRRRGVDELADSLSANRMRRESLDAMLEAARRAAPLLTRYLDVKARLLGKEKLGFADLSAPVGTLGKMSWASAEDFVKTHFDSYHGDLAALARRAFSERWIEAEDRDHKRQGGWCGKVGNPAGVSRIFMTYGETFRSTTTLAHELGHAFHNWALRDAHPARRAVTSTLAETASIFAENIVRDAALAAADDRDSRLAMLDARLSAGVSFLMNIPFRYYLERDLYVQRAGGDLDPDVLSARTVHFQRQCYSDHLASWYPHFWAEKLHFYMASRSFYNYPYTFGYLFSSLVYQRARAAGPGYHPQYMALLERTGWDRAEPLAQAMLGLDLTDPDAWYGGIEPLEADLAAFEQAAGA